MKLSIVSTLFISLFLSAIASTKELDIDKFEKILNGFTDGFQKKNLALIEYSPEEKASVYREMSKLIEEKQRAFYSFSENFRKKVITYNDLKHTPAKHRPAMKQQLTKEYQEALKNIISLSPEVENVLKECQTKNCTNGMQKLYLQWMASASSSLNLDLKIGKDIFSKIPEDSMQALARKANLVAINKLVESLLSINHAETACIPCEENNTWDEGSWEQKINNSFAHDVTDKELAFICSKDETFFKSFKFDQLTLKKKGLKVNDYKALACIAQYSDLALDKELQLKLVKGLMDKDVNVRKATIDLFALIKPLDKDVQVKLVDGLKDQDVAIRKATIDLFAAIKPQDKDLQMKLADGLKDKDIAIRKATFDLFAKIQPQDKDLQMKLTDGLKDKDVAIRKATFDLFAKIKPQDKDLQMKLIDGLTDKDSYVRQVTIGLFNAIKPQDKELLIKLADGLTNDDSYVRQITIDLFAAIKPQDKELQMKLAEGLKDQDVAIRIGVIQLFAAIKPQDKDLQMKLADGLTHNNSDIRKVTFDLFAATKPQDKEIQMKLLGGLKDEDANVRKAMINSFAAIKPQDKEIQMKLLNGLMDNDMNVRRATFDLFTAAIKPQDIDVQLKFTPLGRHFVDDLSFIKPINKKLNQSEAEKACADIGMRLPTREKAIALSKNVPSFNNYFEFWTAEITARPWDGNGWAWSAGEIIEYGRHGKIDVFCVPSVPKYFSASIKLQDKDVQMKLIDGLKDQNAIFRKATIDLFTTIKPQDKDIQMKLIEGLKDQNVIIRKATIDLFAAIKPQDKDIQMKLIDGLTDKDASVCKTTIDLFAAIKPQDKEVKKKLTSLNKDLKNNFSFKPTYGKLIHADAEKACLDIGMRLPTRKEAVARAKSDPSLTNDDMFWWTADTVFRDSDFSWAWTKNGIEKYVVDSRFAFFCVLNKKPF